MTMNFVHKLKISTLFLVSLFYLVSCEEEVLISKMEFEKTEAEVSEGESTTININIAEPAKHELCINVSISNSTAELGTDYQLNQLVTPTETFAVWISKGATSVSFEFAALEDFESEETETVSFTIESHQEVQLLDNAAVTVSIVDVENYPIENRAIQFDGVDDYINLGNIYDNLAFPVTMSAWIWLDPTAANGSIPILDTQDGLPLYNGLGFLTSNTSSVAAQYGDGLGENNSAFRRAKSAVFAPITGRWVNFVIVVRGSSDMSLYYNGIDVGGDYSGSSTNAMNSNSPTEVAKIGVLNQNGAVFRFKGLMDEIKIWNRSLSQDEIQKVIFTKQSNTYPGLIGYWDFDEPTGNQALDKSANQFHGTLMGNPTRVVSTAPIN
jgi:hypothetical protein